MTAPLAQGAIVLWSIVIYPVMAHWVRGGGWLADGGTLDFAGGVPVEMASGFSALAAALVVGARRDYGRQALLPHNGVYALLGAGLLWFGWFGFNGGSGIGVGQTSILAFVNTLLARRARCSCGSCSTSRATGASRRSARRRRSSSAAWASRRHAATSARCGRWSSAGSPRCRATSDGLLYGNAGQLGWQALAVLAATTYAFAGTWVLLRLLGPVMPLRAAAREESLGMDVVEHGEEAYTRGEGAILVTTEAGVRPETPVVA